MAKTLKVKIINPNQILFEGEAKAVLVPGRKATMGILSDHTPMFAEVTKGDILIKGEKEELVAVESGILRIHNDELLILVSSDE